MGEGHDFLNGCPNCGYAGTANDSSVGLDPVDYPGNRTRRRPDTPVWAWPLAIGILLVVFVGLVVVYLRL